MRRWFARAAPTLPKHDAAIAAIIAGTATAGRAAAWKQRTVAVRHVGRERQPVAIVDDFAPDPDALREAAASAVFAPGRLHYPGLRAPLPPGYFKDNAALIAQLLRDLLDLPDGARVLDASFSIVTVPPAELRVEQRLPHVDALEPGRIALVHYLSPADPDGTAFFRHRATGFETLDADRSRTYLPTLNAELARGGVPGAGYIAADSALFEHLDTVPARYNRAVLYRSAMLHSGAITPGRDLPADPATGRLTITGFLAG